MRLNRYLASAGLGSRRACEGLIRDGLVTINGEVVTSLATQIGAGDKVEVHGKQISSQPLVYLALNKPTGFLTTCSDPERRKTVLDLIPPSFGRLFHVGRLDKDSEGLLILTNDGDLAQRLSHPAHLSDKEYEVVLDQPFDVEHIGKLLTGFHIEGGKAKMQSVYRLSPRKVKVILRQGIKRQIRLMFYKLGYEVKQLKRTRIGFVKLGRMRPGQWRLLTRDEVRLLQRGNADSKTLSHSTPQRPRRKRVED